MTMLIHILNKFGLNIEEKKMSCASNDVFFIKT